MAHGTWKTTGGGGAITAGGVAAILGAVVVFADRRGIEHAGGEVLTALAVVGLVLLVLAVAGFVLVGRLLRRGEDRFAARLAEHRTIPAATLRPLPQSTLRVLPAGQPPAVHYHFHGDPRDWQLFPGHNGAGRSQITPPFTPGDEVPQ